MDSRPLAKIYPFPCRPGEGSELVWARRTSVDRRVYGQPPPWEGSPQGGSKEAQNAQSYQTS